ncbi:MAG: DUF4127 family protein [Cyanothece sp. SIO1E1]|nr:DUF4127 family protein [Cyanothece sp. SIO1E1]
MKILYIPLDERPCNFYYPQMIANLQNQLTLVLPPRELLGNKKQAANVDSLWRWIDQQIADCQLAIFSIEMLVYGGLLPSRLHTHNIETLIERLHRIHHLKTTRPQLIIFASNLIMRSPAYNSSEEEPDYYAAFGESIFNWGWLKDKSNRVGLTPPEEDQLTQIDQALPPTYLNDYQLRREKNLAINQAVIDLVQRGIISFLSIPQDDCAPYGFTAIDQKQVVGKIAEMRLQRQVHLYPGADEVGCTLLARAYAQLTQKRKKLYLLYSSVNSEQIVPRYEDRPLGESIKSHILAVGAQMVATPEAADCILAVNTAGHIMQEAWDQAIQDLTYTSHRNLRFFVAEIEQFLTAGYQVAIADVAFTNGGETELVQLLDDTALWEQTLAYAGWNTSCNTIGTVLATALMGLESDHPQAIDFNKIYHLLEGWAYQSVVRMDMVKHYLPTIGATYYDFNGKDTVINLEMARRIRAVWTSVMHQSFQHWEITQMDVFSPWQRMFEIGIQMELKQL